MFQPDVQAALSAEVRSVVQGMVADGVSLVFWTVVVAAACCLAVCLALPGPDSSNVSR